MFSLKKNGFPILDIVSNFAVSAPESHPYSSKLKLSISHISMFRSHVMHKQQAQAFGSGFELGGLLSKRVSSPFHHCLVAKKPEEKWRKSRRIIQPVSWIIMFRACLGVEK